jgi:hypothetical protein
VMPARNVGREGYYPGQRAAVLVGAIIKVGGRIRYAEQGQRGCFRMAGAGVK